MSEIDLQQEIKRLLEEAKERDRQILQLLTENEERDRQIALNSAKIQHDRKNRKFGDMAVWLLVGLMIALVFGYRRETDGGWSYAIAPELAAIVLGGGGLAHTMLRKDDDEEG